MINCRIVDAMAEQEAHEVRQTGSNSENFEERVRKTHFEAAKRIAEAKLQLEEAMRDELRAMSDQLQQEKVDKGIWKTRMTEHGPSSSYDVLEGNRRNKAGMFIPVENGIDGQMQRASQSFLSTLQSSGHGGTSDHDPPSKEVEFSVLATEKVLEPKRFSLDGDGDDDDEEEEEEEDSFQPTLQSWNHRGNPDYRPPLKEEDFIVVTTGEALEAERFFVDNDEDTFLPTLQSWDHPGNSDHHLLSKEEEFIIVTTGEALAAERFFVDDDAGDHEEDVQDESADEEDSFLQSFWGPGNSYHHFPSNEEERIVATTEEPIQPKRFSVEWQKEFLNGCYEEDVQDESSDEEDSFQSFWGPGNSYHHFPSKEEECIVATTEEPIQPKRFSVEWQKEFLKGFYGLTEAGEVDEERGSENFGEQAREQHHPELVEGYQINNQAPLKLLRGAMINSLVFGLYCLDIYLWGL